MLPTYTLIVPTPGGVLFGPVLLDTLWNYGGKVGTTSRPDHSHDNMCKGVHPLQKTWRLTADSPKNIRDERFL